MAVKPWTLEENAKLSHFKDWLAQSRYNKIELGKKVIEWQKNTLELWKSLDQLKHMDINDLAQHAYTIHSKFLKTKANMFSSGSHVEDLKQHRVAQRKRLSQEKALRHQK